MASPANATTTAPTVTVATWNPSKVIVAPLQAGVKQKVYSSSIGAESVRSGDLRERARVLKGAFDETAAAVVEKFRTLYVHNPMFGLQMADGACPLMPGLLKGADGEWQIREHIAGRQSLVLYPAFESANKVKYTRYGMWDVDFKVAAPNETVEAERAAFVLAGCRQALEGMGLDAGAAYAYLTGMKGCRIALHFDRPITVAAWVRLFHAVVWWGDEGQRLDDLPDVKFECRPTMGGTGVRPPFSVHRVTGNPCAYIDPATALPCEDQHAFLLAIRTVDAGGLFDALKRAPKNYEIKDRKRRKRRTQKAQGALQTELLTRTELDALLNGYLLERGLRHRYLWQLAALLCERGVPQEEAHAELERWTLRQAAHGVADSDPGTWREDLRSTVERAYSGQVRLLVSVKRTAPAVTSAEVRRLIAPLKKESSRRVMAYVLQHAKTFADEVGEFYLGVLQITDALNTPDGFDEEWDKKLEQRKGDVSKTLRALIANGYLLKVREFDRRERLATVYRLPEVPDSEGKVFPLSGGDGITCHNSASVMLVQTLPDAELRRLLSRSTYKRVKEEGATTCGSVSGS